MSPLAIVLIVVVALLLLLFIGGTIARARRTADQAGGLLARVAAADQALEAARAADRGWDPVRLEEAARQALESERPDFRYDSLHLVLVDDQPGIHEDRAELAAVGAGEVVHVAVVRRGDSWVAEGLS